MKASLESQYVFIKGRPEIIFRLNYSDYPILHNHEFWEFLIITSGSYSHTINGKTYTIKQGDSYLIRPDDLHSTTSLDNGSSHINIVVPDHVIKKFLDIINLDLYNYLLNKDLVHFNLNYIQIQCIREYGIFIMGNNEESQKHAISNLLVSKFLNYAIDKNVPIMFHKPEWLISLLNTMEKPENLCWRVSDIVDEVHFSRTHLNRIFEKYFNCSVSDYLTNIKFNAAESYLRYSDYSVGEIASLLGFLSVSHFNHLFKEKFNCSPLDYRKSVTHNLID